LVSAVSLRGFDLVREADIDETNLCQVPIRGISAYRTAAVGAKRPLT
jgi:hypothetical protein